MCLAHTLGLAKYKIALNTMHRANTVLQARPGARSHCKPRSPHENEIAHTSQLSVLCTCCAEQRASDRSGLSICCYSETMDCYLDVRSAAIAQRAQLYALACANGSVCISVPRLRHEGDRGSKHMRCM